MKLITLSRVGVLFLFVLCLQGNAREAYYPKIFIDNLKSKDIEDRDLKYRIKDIVQNYHYAGRDGHDIISSFCPQGKSCTRQISSFSYKDARKYLFGTLHLQKDSQGYYLEDVYCQQTYRSDDGVGVNRIPNHQKINCEHTWPQSKFSKTESKHTQKVDLHHLFPVGMRANSTRSNHPLAEVSGRMVNSNCTDAFIGKAHGTNQTAFEPPNEHKGDAARAIFYFAARYGLTIDDLQETNLRKWHMEDPVSPAEQVRNDLIEDYQKNRNPFIDYPQLVDMIENF